MFTIAACVTCSEEIDAGSGDDASGSGSGSGDGGVYYFTPNENTGGDDGIVVVVVSESPSDDKPNETLTGLGSGCSSRHVTSSLTSWLALVLYVTLTSVLMTSS